MSLKLVFYKPWNQIGNKSLTNSTLEDVTNWINENHKDVKNIEIRGFLYAIISPLKTSVVTYYDNKIEHHRLPLKSESFNKMFLNETEVIEHLNSIMDKNNTFREYKVVKITFDGNKQNIEYF